MMRAVRGRVVYVANLGLVEGDLYGSGVVQEGDVENDEVEMGEWKMM
jgi:hypothetical protein